MRPMARSCLILVTFLTGCSGGKTQLPPGEGPDEPELSDAAVSLKEDAAGKPTPKDAKATAEPDGASSEEPPSPDASTRPDGTTSAPGPDGGGGPVEGPDLPGCKLVWSPSAMRDGEKAFELAEMPDRMQPGGSAPTHPNAMHISAVPEHDAYRIDSHYSPPGAADYDRVTQTGPTRTDRLRCETRGMVGPAGQVDLLNNQTWRLTWSFYLPSSLKGTSRFTHIMQMKYVDKGGGASGSPIITLTLRPNDRIELLLWLGGGSVSIIDASALHDKWLSADLTIKIAPQGSVHWTLKDGDKVLVDKQQAGTIWPGDAARLRPKWGIYRGITTGVQTTYMLLSDLKAYQCQ
jgi:hypothetical protein